MNALSKYERLETELLEMLLYHRIPCGQIWKPRITINEDVSGNFFIWRDENSSDHSKCYWPTLRHAALAACNKYQPELYS